MDKRLMDICCYIYSNTMNGDQVSVKDIVERFNMKLKSVKKALELISEINDSCRLEYNDVRYAQDDSDADYFIDIEDISEENKEYIMLSLADEFVGIKLRLNLEDTLKLYNIIEESYIDKKIRKSFLNEIGTHNIKEYKYITKGIGKYPTSDKTISTKNDLIEAIYMDNIINLKYYSRKNKRPVYINNLLPLGVYYDAIKSNWYAVCEYKEKISEYRIDMIQEIIAKGQKQTNFDIEKYLRAMRDVNLKIKIFSENNVLHKILNIFNGYEYELDEVENGTYILNVMVKDAFYFKPFIDSFGESVIVLEPKRLRDEIIEDSKKLLDRIKKYEVK